MRQGIGVWCAAAVVAVSAMALVAACEPSGGKKQGELHLSVGAVTAADVAGVLYEIVCQDGTSVSQYVPLEEEGLSDLVDPSLAGESFADFFTLLPPGPCTVTATAMLGPDEPAPGCAQVTEDVVVVPNQTTEVLLVIVCEPAPVGGLDVITVVTDGPSITDIDYATTKFILQCEETTVTVTADGGEAPLTYAFQVVTTPAGANYSASSAGNVFTFSAETQGLYEVKVTVTDASGATTTFVFPIHVADDPDVEHCFEGCCRLPDGHVFFGDVDACLAAGGIEVPEEICKAEICCETPDGAQIVQASSCPQGAALPPEKCELCCKTPEGFAYVATPQECKDKGGVAVSSEACEELVCCKGAGGNSYVPAIDCPFGQVQPPAACEAPEICCQLPDGTTAVLGSDVCKEKGGVQVALDLCLPEVCCKLPDGTYSTVSQTTCTKLGGAVASLDLCKEVCCVFKDGTAMMMLVGNCQAAGGVSSPPADCEGPQTQVWQADYTLDPAAPCAPEPYLVVPSSGANKLAVYDLTTLLPLPTSPFDTCSNPSRIMMDANTDVYASCREGTLGGRVRKHTRDGVFIWETPLPNCTGARGVAMSGNGRLFAVCSTGTRALYELDPATGAVLATVLLDATRYPYGVTAAADALYVAYLYSAVSRIDLATLNLDWTVPVTPGPYGISADTLGGVWIGGQMLQRLDSLGNVTDMIDSSDGGTYTSPIVTGVQVALDGTVNGAMPGHDLVIRHDPLANTTVWWPADVTANTTYGITSDANDNVYTINMSSSSLTKFDPGTGTPTFFGPDALNTTILVSPYGYSGDMTGLTACLAGTTDIWVSTPFDSGSATTTWGVISWTQTTPPGSSVSVYYSLDGGATWTQATNGQNLGVVGQTIQVKAILQATIPGNEPTLSSVSITYTP